MELLALHENWNKTLAVYTKTADDDSNTAILGLFI
jgi:hypothetical protein